MMVPAWVAEVAYCAVVPTGVMIGLVVLGLVYRVDRVDRGD